MEDNEKISGIYNYCDRWCEKCSFTSKCMNYESLEKKGLLENNDISNAEFWKKMGDIFSETKELLYKAAEEQGIDLSAIQIDQEEAKRKHEDLYNHFLVQDARKYANLVNEFFETHDANIKDQLIHLMDLEKAKKVGAAIEIIRWYQHFIQVKLMSAINFEKENEIDINEISEYNYSLGSAKIALISVDRSISAFTVLYNEFTSLNDDIITLFALLERIKKNIESLFPKVHEFIRPGFDE